MIHKVLPGQTIVDGSKVKPGDTVILSGVYQITPYFKGLDGVTITNDGPVHLQSSVKFDNCRNFKLLGNQKDVFKISALQDGASGVAIYNKSTDFEIAHLLISGTAFAGIMCKDDGQKRGGGFTMRGVHIHHNVIELTGGECLYIGGTDPKGHDLQDVHVHDNKVLKSGWDGMQFGNVVAGLSVHDNQITGTGLNIRRLQDEVQDNGIQIGDRSKGKVYRNTIRDARGNGIIALGTGCDIYDNKIFSAGESGIFLDSRPDTTEVTILRANTIILPKMYGIAMMDTHNKGLKNTATHNMILNPGKQYFKNGNGIDLKEFNNYTDLNIYLAEYLMNKP